MALIAGLPAVGGRLTKSGGSERAAVADLDRVHATEVVDLAAAVGAPAEPLVEGAAFRVRLEHPQEQLVDVGSCPEAIDGCHQLRADALSPRRGIHVDGVDLRTPLDGRQFVVSNRAGVRETPKRIGPIQGNERRRVRLRQGTDAGPPLRRAGSRIEAVEEFRRQDSRVRGAPPGDLDARDRLGVIGLRQANSNYGCASQVSPGSRATTSAEVCSRSSSGVPDRIGKVA